LIIFLVGFTCLVNIVSPEMNSKFFCFAGQTEIVIKQIKGTRVKHSKHIVYDSQYVIWKVSKIIAKEIKFTSWQTFRARSSILSFMLLQMKKIYRYIKLPGRRMLLYSRNRSVFQTIYCHSACCLYHWYFVHNCCKVAGALRAHLQGQTINYLARNRASHAVFAWNSHG